MQYKLSFDVKKPTLNAVFLYTDAADLKQFKTICSKVDFIQKNQSDKNSNLKYFIEQEAITVFVKLNADTEAARKLGNECFGLLAKLKTEEIAIHTTESNGLSLAFLEGLLLSTYSFNKYKKKKEKESVLNIALSSKEISPESVEKTETIVQATFIARDFVNEPHIHLNATQYAADLKKLGKDNGFDVTVLDKKKIESLKMGGLLGVNKGSIQPPTFSILEWKPKNARNKKPYVLVGKGVMFDTGGLSLKPTPSSMDLMKSDMAGSAAVAATIYACSKLKLPLHVVALIPATDNRPGLDAITPGDIITISSGHTVEVLNTDAEGRLILADALHYAKKYKPELVIDVATLTGAAAAAIGPQGIVCMGTASEEVKNELKKSGENTHERLVEFPLWKEYAKLIESDVADIKNIGGAVAGAITAGKFLEVFTEGYPWMHFDIAGSAFLMAPDGYKPKGGTGASVRLLIDFLSQKANQS
jgi:leucyl aminopeptidase